MKKLLSATCYFSALLIPVAVYATPVTTNLVTWLRADDLNGDGSANNPANGTPVSDWLDSHTSHNDFAQGDVNFQPIYQAAGGPAGMPAVVFDGVNDSIRRSAGITHNDPTYFIVFKNDSSSGYPLADYVDSVSSLAYRAIESRASGATQSYGRDASGNVRSADTPGPDVGKFQLYVSWVDTGVGQMNWRQSSTGISGGFGDGATIAGASGVGAWNPTSWTALYGVTLGAFDLGFSRSDFANASISEVLIYSGALSGTDRTAVENYLIAKYSTIPEPTTIVLFVTGIFGLSCQAWRTRK